MAAVALAPNQFPEVTRTLLRRLFLSGSDDDSAALIDELNQLVQTIGITGIGHFQSAVFDGMDTAEEVRRRKEMILWFAECMIGQDRELLMALNPPSILRACIHDDYFLRRRVLKLALYVEHAQNTRYGASAIRAMSESLGMLDRRQRALSRAGEAFVNLMVDEYLIDSKSRSAVSPRIGDYAFTLLRACFADPQSVMDPRRLEVLMRQFGSLGNDRLKAVRLILKGER